MHKCTPSGIYGAVQAHIAIDDGPIFKAKNINEASFEAQLSFAKVMNKLEGKQFDVNIAAHAKDESLKGTLVNRVNMGRTPEALLPKQVYGKIDKKMTQWDAYYKRSTLPKLQAIEKKYEKLAGSIQKAKVADKAERLKVLESKKQKELAPLRAQAAASYKTLVGKQFGNAKDQIQQTYNQHFENPKRLDGELKRMGMTRRDSYYAHNYLSYLENGGPFFNFKEAAGNKAGGEMVQELTSNITGKKISFDPKQVIYNSAEFLQKAPAVAGFGNTLGGIADAHAAAQKAGLTIFDRLPELERQGIYANDYTPLRPEGKWDTTARSQNFLDNLAYFTGKKMGNVQEAMKGIAYRPKPWNDTFGFQDPRMKAQFGFMSFQFRHMQQYGGWWKDAVLNKSPKAAKQLAIYSVMTGIIFGDRAGIPAPVYEATKAVYPDIDKDIKSSQSQIPILGEVLNNGLLGTGAKLATGGNLEVDMTKYARPGGGVAIGIGQDLVQGAHDAVTRTIPKTAHEIQNGRTDKAAAVAINGIVQGSQLFKQGANALIQKTVDGVTKAYLEDEFTPEGIAKYTGQKYLGKDAVKTTN
jgi:hypothetical protein